MLLAVDIGNTTTVWGLFDDGSLIANWRTATVRVRSADEYAILLEQLLALRGLARAVIDAAIVSCVVPPALPALVQMLRRELGLDPVIVRPGVNVPLRIRDYSPGEVGADRVVNAVAAFARYGGPIIILDSGTATTFCVVNRSGEYLGGAIVPGPSVAADALFERTAKLPRVDVVRPERVIGRNTVESMQSGLYYGYAALIDGVVERILEELGEPAQVIATGGFATELANICRRIDAVDPQLTLEGLRLIWEAQPPP